MNRIIIFTKKSYIDILNIYQEDLGPCNKEVSVVSVWRVGCLLS
jgi:hypothetical protein